MEMKDLTVKFCCYRLMADVFYHRYLMIRSFAPNAELITAQDGVDIEHCPHCGTPITLDQESTELREGF